MGSKNVLWWIRLYTTPDARCDETAEVVEPDRREYDLDVEGGFCGVTLTGQTDAGSVKIVDYREATCRLGFPARIVVDETRGGEEKTYYSADPDLGTQYEKCARLSGDWRGSCSDNTEAAIKLLGKVDRSSGLCGFAATISQSGGEELLLNLTMDGVSSQVDQPDPLDLQLSSHWVGPQSDDMLMVLTAKQTFQGIESEIIGSTTGKLTTDDNGQTVLSWDTVHTHFRTFMGVREVVTRPSKTKCSLYPDQPRPR